MNITAPVAAAIRAVDFGVLSTDDILAMSVKRVVNPVTLDNLQHPTPGGLYDTALGAFLDHPCSVCHLKLPACPGHCGHIDLPVHVYHCEYIAQLFRFYRAHCCFCHHLRLSRVDKSLIVCKLRLIRHGLLKEAEDLLDVVDNDEDREDEPIGLAAKRYEFTAACIRKAGLGASAPQHPVEVNEAITEARQATIGQLHAMLVRSRKCAHCKGINHTYRKNGAVSIFRKPLKPKERAANTQLGLTVDQSSLELLNKMQDERTQQRLKGEKEQRAALRGSAQHDDEGVADMDSNSSQDEDGDVRILDAISEPSLSEGEQTSEEQEEGTGLLDDAARPAANKKTKKPDRSKEGEGETHINPSEVHATMMHLFDKERDLMVELYGNGSTSTAPSADMFFIKTLLVPPNKYRKESKTGPNEISESGDNSSYKKVLAVAQDMFELKMELDSGHQPTEKRQRGWSDFQTQWQQLQQHVNGIIDSDRESANTRLNVLNARGVKQKLEKKEGVMRMNIMGKRVNFAARSVISPDPNIEANEVGIPPVFAKKLTYPEPVTAHSFEELKQAVLNGPDIWPGASFVEDENGQVTNLRGKSAVDRQAIANSLLAPSSTIVSGSRNKKVHRHLTNGDVVIMNRQPTLHKPSMMAHRAKVLPGEKTIRLHYANCNSYNADFDGDEMNMHFPQNEIARAEAVQIADTDHQYLSTTAGEPLRGLIQDHISMAVWLTCMDTFFDREQYQELVYAAMRPEDNHITTDRIETVPPMLIKPVKRWTGKQIITTVLLNIQPKGFAPIHMAAKSQIPKEQWSKSSHEDIVRIDRGEMLTGILDKKQIGPKPGGFIHIIYEAYGHAVAGKLISILGRLLTKYLNMNAFSCGVEDLVMTAEGERQRKKVMESAKDQGLEVAARYVSLQDSKPTPQDRELLDRLEMVTRDDEKLAGLDTMAGNATKGLTSEITKVCLPGGLSKPFPRNQMQAMTTSGAKGSGVNASLISCALGQQNLEGRRVPIMVSGKTLPSFKPYDPSFRAGGYVEDRFLTGVRPQEYYFHLMAGREGLVDTAVKTSRSGYLQRCLVKGLEGLRAGYDASVRDEDGTMIQTVYGEDGLDITRQAKLYDFNFVATNFHSLLASLNVVNDAPRTTLTVEADNAREYNKKADKLVRKTNNIACVDPALAVFPPSTTAGSTSEKYLTAAREYLKNNPDRLIKDKKADIDSEITKRAMESVMEFNYLKAVVQAGEAVGVIAAQSLGEPSTQMTLNTFHLAGHAAKNVTLGIPRLREILMTASKQIRTPTMDLHFIEEISEKEREDFARHISRRSLAELVEDLTVTTRSNTKSVGGGRAYDVELTLYPSDEYTKAYAIPIEDVARTAETKLMGHVSKLVQAELRKRGKGRSLAKIDPSDAAPDVGQSAGRVRDIDTSGANADNEGGDDDDDDDAGEDDAGAAKRRANADDGVTYDDPDESDEEIARAGERDAQDDADDPDDEAYVSGGSRQGTPVASAAGTSAPNTPGGRKGKEEQKKSKAERAHRIRGKYSNVAAFDFNDDGAADRITFTLEYPIGVPRLMMLPIIKRATHAALIQEIPGIHSATLIKPERADSGPSYVATAGANLMAMRAPEHQGILNPHRLYTNSVFDMIKLYGVEAGRSTIVRELGAVFGGHGIDVDPRHLTLVADYMTRTGGYLPFSRTGMKTKAGPFAKMSFETTMGFLRDAVLYGAHETLDGPSARITVGRVGRQGTGAFDVMLPVA